MKPKYTTILAILVATTTVGMLTINMQQVSAPRTCGGCTAFNKLTHELEKAVIDAATNGDPNTIPALLEQYNQDVLVIFARGN